MDCSPPGSSVHGILQARILEWVAMPSSRGTSQPRYWTQASRITGKFFIIWATREAQEYWNGWPIPSPGDLPDPRMELGFPALHVDSFPTRLPGKPKYATMCKLLTVKFMCFTRRVTVTYSCGCQFNAWWVGGEMSEGGLRARLWGVVEGGEEAEVGGNWKVHAWSWETPLCCLHLFSIRNCGCNVASPSDFQKKPEMKIFLIYDISYMWNLICDTNELISEAETESQTYGCPGRRRGGKDLEGVWD